MKTKRWHRRLLRVLGALVLFLVLLFFLSTSTIDTSPYFETSYYKNSIENLDNATKNMVEAKGQLLAGFAKLNITPTIVSQNPDPDKGEFSAIKMAGFGDGKIATAVHDTLYAKAVSVTVADQELVFVSADLVMIPEGVVLEVAANLKDILSREQLYFGATHTHSSIGNCTPGLIGESFEGEYQPDVVRWLGRELSSLIRKARANKQPAKFASDAIHVPNLIRNRIIGETGRLNDKLNIVSFIQNKGKKAVIGIYGAHATTIGTWNDQFSADYPGYFQKHLEEQPNIDLALFFAGTVGSHTNKSDGGGEKFEKSKFIGTILADSAQVVLNRMQYDSVMTLRMATSELETPRLQALYISDQRRISSYLGNKLLPEIKSIHLQGLKLNNLIWITLPYELSGEYGIDLKNALKLKGYNSALTSFNGGYLGYVVPQKYYYYDTYEARLMGWYGPSMGDYLMELNFRLANKLTDSRL